MLTGPVRWASIHSHWIAGYPGSILHPCIIHIYTTYSYNTWIIQRSPCRKVNPTGCNVRRPVASGSGTPVVILCVWGVEQSKAGDTLHLWLYGQVSSAGDPSRSRWPSDGTRWLSRWLPCDWSQLTGTGNGGINSWDPLTHWGRDKMAAIFQTTFSNGFSWIKMYEFRLTFHWSLFLRVQLPIFQHWFR